MDNFVFTWTTTPILISNMYFLSPLRKRRKRKKKEEEMQTLGKDITPINEDIEETNIS